MDHSKRKNIYIIVFVVTTIIAACVAVYFGIKVNEGKGDLQIANKDIEEYKSQLEQAKANVNQGEVNVPKTEEKVVEKGKLFPFNINMLRQGDSNLSYKIVNSLAQEVKIIVNEGKAYLYCQEEIKSWIGEENCKNLIYNKEQEIVGFDKKVIDAYVSGTGMSTGDVVLLFLMEDGSMEYLPLAKVSTNRYKSSGKIKNIQNIVRVVEHVLTTPKEGNATKTVIAIDNQGYCYDVLYMLGNYLY